MTEEPARPERMSAAPAGAGADRQDAAPGLVGFVWAHSRREQIWLLLLTALSFPVVYLSLEVPKIIVNDAISGTDFPRSVAGVEIGQIPYLLLLCLLFLGLVVVINGFKWVINIGIGMAGERLLRRMRFELADQVARFPMRRLRGVRQGETIQAVMGEIEPLGGFFGEVLVTPAFQGGLLAVYMAFIFMQDPWLGLAAIAFYPVQSVLVPVLQARIVRLNRARAANARGVADRIGELISLAPEIRGHGTLGWHLAQLSAGLHSNTLIRQAIFRRKYTIKFLNNFIAQLTPFFFYAIGGALVIAGRLDFGALVAVIAAYKDLAGPWKAVLGYVQRLSDFTARYRFVRESVAVEGGIDPRRAAPGPAAPLEGDLSVRRVAVDPETDLPAIPALDLTAGEVMALTGGQPGAREAVLRLLAGIDPPARGHVRVGEADLAEQPLCVIGATCGHVPERPGLVRGTLRENLAYGLFRASPPLPETPDSALAERLAEAAATGNPATDPEADWADPAAAGLAGRDALDAEILALAREFGLSATLLSVALGRILPAEDAHARAGPLMAVRSALAARLHEIADLVEPWDEARFNANAPLLENLLFALPTYPAARPSDHLDDPQVRRILRRSGSDRFLARIGWHIAEQLAGIAGAAGPGSDLLDRLGGFTRRDVSDAAALVESAGGRGPGQLGRAARVRLAALAANFIEARDHLDLLDDRLRGRILALRARNLPLVRRAEGLLTLDSDSYNPWQTAADAILGAPRRHDRRTGWSRIDRLIEETIRDAGLEDAVLQLGLAAPAEGAGLASLARRRIGLMRAVLKRPRFLMLSTVADLHPAGEGALLAALRARLPEAGIVFVPAGSAGAGLAEQVATIDADARLTVARS